MNTLSVGNVLVSGCAFLAPMSGITDIGMRRLASHFGASLVVSEMVASSDLARGSEEARTRAEGDGINPHVVQLAGCDPYWMSEGARVAETAGAHIIDINMGCPAKRVTGGWAGSALMRDLDHATRLIEATVASVSVPVTLKMRLGWDEAAINAPELAYRAVVSGVKMITVHGRTRQQFYKGEANWKAVLKVRQAIPDVPLVVNGDITSFDSARHALAASQADAVMIGRAALGRPWLVGQIARALNNKDDNPPPRNVRLAAAMQHYETLLGTYGIKVGVRHARKHLAAYADDALTDASHSDEFLAYARKLRSQLVTSQIPSEVIQILKELYAENNLSSTP